MKKTLILTKAFGGATLSLIYAGDNAFKLEINKFKFSKGKSDYYSANKPVNTANLISESEIIITLAEIKRLGTYKIYADGKEISFFGEWIDHGGKRLYFQSENDFYYYFRRSDCGIICYENNTIFHNKLGLPNVINK